MKTIYSRKIQLNDYQTAAVEDVSPACLVNACVGSGKTTVLTEKVRWLHEQKQVPYEEMMVLTFTNKAADEIASRLGIGRSSRFGTFHSVAAALLNESLPVEECGWQKDFTIILPEEEQELALTLIEEHKLKIKYRNRLAKRLEQERPQAASAGSGAQLSSGSSSRIKDDLQQVFPLLQEAKKQQNRMSYADLLDNCMLLLAQHPLQPQWVIVDEVQDCNRQQVEMLKRLVGPDSHLFAVGDPNQMIYSFRGGDQSLFYYIREYFHARELSLPVNYRSDPAILSVANRFRQFGVKIEGTASGEPAASGSYLGSSLEKVPVSHYYDAFTEAEILADKILQMHEEGTPYEEIAVLYRLKEQSPMLEASFARAGIPCRTQEQIREEERNREQVREEDRNQHREQEEQAQEEDRSRQQEERPQQSGVSLLTLHACKGLEFDVVFIIGVNQGLIPMNGKDFSQKEEEQRLFFVGLTRARRYLELSWYTNPTQVQAAGEMSPFLRMIPPQLLDMEEERTQEEKAANLQKLRREVIRQRACGRSDESRIEAAADAQPAEAETSVMHASHPKYGTGVVVEEDDMMIAVEFPGYGRKEFMKMFGEVTIL